VPKQTGEEDFQPITKHAARHQVHSNVGQRASACTAEKRIANTFSALMEEEVVQAIEGEGGHIPNG